MENFPMSIPIMDHIAPFMVEVNLLSLISFKRFSKYCFGLYMFSMTSMGYFSNIFAVSFNIFSRTI